MSANTSKGCGLLYEMGTGKTLTSIMIMGAMYQAGKISKVLVAAPSSVCGSWVDDLEKFAGFKYTARVLLGDKKKRLKSLQELESFPFKGLKIAIINHENVWREGIKEALEDWQPDMVICDESQRIKTHDAQQSKQFHRLGDLAKYKLILSGTPVQNNAVDIFSQYRFLDPTIFGTNFYAFRNKYCIMGGFNNRQIIGYRDLEGLTRKMYSIAHRVTKEDALDLPDQIFKNIYLELEPKEKKIYDQLKRESFAELESGGQITATTVLTKLLRLQQLTGGFLVADEASKPELVSDIKIKALEEILDDYVVEAGKKLVVFVRFRAEIDLIKKLLEKKKIKHSMIYGDVPQEQRGDIVRDFQDNPETLVIVCQLQCASLGITLTAASTCVYYSVDWNYANYSQSLARIHRLGQTQKCTYLTLVVKGTVDETVQKALEAKEDLANTVVNNWKSLFT